MMKSSIDGFRIACVSDIHLGNKRNRTSDIIEALEQEFPDNEETGKIDLLVLAGDVFDRLLNLPEDDVVEIDLWIVGLLQLCSKWNIALRVLEGTPSHDWMQSQRFESIRKIKNIKLDFEYVKTLSIEYMEKFGIHVLYVPDEWDVTTDRTLKQVHELMEARHLTQVDYAFMHGNFEYQLPAHLKKIQRHSSEEYLKIVKHYIFIGHIHIHSSFDRIIAQGSFDRLSHGEEGPKGHVRAIVTEDERRFFFIKNKKARIYKTIECKDIDLENTFASIKKILDKIPDDSCIRIKADSNHPILANINQLIAMYPGLVWSKLAVSKEAEEQLQEDEDEPVNSAITITKSNIIPLLMDRMINSKYDSALINRSEKLLSNIING